MGTALPALRPKVRCYYRHFKGDLYFVESIGKHTESGETLVAYVRADEMYDPEAGRWFRPLADHDKAFTTPGRFEKVGQV
jgi:hypothetical protein